MTPSITHDWKRHEMWCKLIPVYGIMDKNEKKKAKRAYAEERGMLPHMINEKVDVIFKLYNHLDSLGSLEPTPSPAQVVAEMWQDHPANNKKCGVPHTNKENNKMFYDEDGMSACSETLLQRNQLVGRINDISCEKDTELEIFFGLRDDVAPKTVNEIIERIKAGMFTIDEDKGDKQGYSVFSYLNWRDPSKKKDHAGYDAAKVKLYAAQKEADDVIHFKTIDEGFAALQAFKAQTFH